MDKNARFMSGAEVATLLGVDPRTVPRWDGKNGFPVPIRTPGGQRRYRRAEVEEYLRRQIANNARSEENPAEG
jgi:excisionase family DNA binding protein